MGIQGVYFKRWLPKPDSDDTRWQNNGIAARCQRTEDTYDRKNYHGKTRKITEGEICKILILENLIIQCNSVKIRGE